VVLTTYTKQASGATCSSYQVPDTKVHPTAAEKTAAQTLAGTWVNKDERVINDPNVQSYSLSMMDCRQIPSTIGVSDPVSIAKHQDIHQGNIYYQGAYRMNRLTPDYVTAREELSASMDQVYSGVDHEPNFEFKITARDWNGVEPATAQLENLQDGSTQTLNWKEDLEKNDDPLNVMARICKYEVSGTTMTEVCRHGFGGPSRRRRVAWADCPRVAPSTGDEVTESHCLSKLTFTKQAGNPSCDSFSHPPVAPPTSAPTIAPSSSDDSSLAIVLSIVGGVVVLVFLCGGYMYFSRSAAAGQDGAAPPMAQPVTQAPVVEGVAVNVASAPGAVAIQKGDGPTGVELQRIGEQDRNCKPGERAC